MSSATLVSLIISGLFVVAIWVMMGFIWQSFRNFFHNNYSFFDVSFIIAYFLEQLVLIVLLVVKPDQITFWVGSFALIVVTTASIQKVMMDSRDRKIRELYAASKNILEQTRDFNYDLIQENEELGKQNKRLSDFVSRKLKKK